MARSLLALGSDDRLLDTRLWAKAIGAYREIFGILVRESALSLHRDLQKETWGACLQGGLPEHLDSLVEHVVGNAVLLRTNTYSIVTSSFGMDTTLTFATMWVPGREASVCPWVWRYGGAMPKGTSGGCCWGAM